MQTLPIAESDLALLRDRPTRPTRPTSPALDAETEAWVRLRLAIQKRREASARADRAWARFRKCQAHLTSAAAEYQAAQDAWESALDAQS